MSTLAVAPGGDVAVPGLDRTTYDLIAGWLLEYPSVHTRRGYGRDLALLAAYLDARGVALLDGERGHMAAWAESMRRGDTATGRPAAESSIARRLSSAASFYGYAVAEEHLPANPLAHLRRPKVGAEESRSAWITRPESRRLLAAAAAHGPAPYGGRAHALVALILTTVARVSDLLLADVADLGHTGGHRVLRVTRKGGKTQDLPIAPWVGVVVDDYLDGRTDGPLLATRARGGGHGRWDEPAVWRLVRLLAGRAGLPGAGELGPHSLRHSGLTHGFADGMPLRDLQVLAGHADPRTTRRYDHLADRLDRSPVYALAAGLAG
ncbi:tyrosine-type recombinase/integrase [Embleya sp. NPDC005971]|uniref:tyrosine-type recombinase/integrase n=1 Tax=Embleya sp. NPDC005971 TaxID=3156724 RepID=UPI0033CFC43E